MGLDLDKKNELLTFTKNYNPVSLDEEQVIDNLVREPWNIREEFFNGQSPTRVFVVGICSLGFHRMPVIVKIGPKEVIEQEYKIYEKYVRGKLPKSANLQCYACSDDNLLAGILYSLIGGEDAFAVTLLEYLKKVDKNKGVAPSNHLPWSPFRNNSDYRNKQVLPLEDTLNSILKDMGTTWTTTTTRSEFSICDSYDPILPVNLVCKMVKKVDNSPDTVLSPNMGCDLTNIKIGEVIEIRGFSVTKVVPRHNHIEVTLNIPPTTTNNESLFTNQFSLFPPPIPKDTKVRSFRVRVRVPREFAKEYRINEQVSSIFCKVIFRRRDLFKNDLSQIPVLGGVEIDKEKFILRMAGETLELENPFVILDQMLKMTPQVELAGCIHGDFHLENIMINLTNGTLAGFIDFARSRSDHALHDLLKFETEFVIHFLAPKFLANGGRPTQLINFYEALHSYQYDHIYNSSKVSLESKWIFDTIFKIRFQATKSLHDPHNFNEYYCCLIIYLLGCLHFSWLSSTLKLAVFITAAAVTGLLKNQPVVLDPFSGLS